MECTFTTYTYVYRYLHAKWAIFPLKNGFPLNFRRSLPYPWLAKRPNMGAQFQSVPELWPLKWPHVEEILWSRFFTFYLQMHITRLKMKIEWRAKHHWKAQFEQSIVECCRTWYLASGKFSSGLMRLHSIKTAIQRLGWPLQTSRRSGSPIS